MFVQSSSNWSATNRFGGAIEVREVRHDRQHRGPGKPERFEVLPVELRIAQRQIAAVDVGLQLAAAAEALPRERAVDADEVLRRRDVVVDERHPIGQRERRARRLRADREVVEQQVVGMAGVDQLAIVARQRLEPAVGRLDEDVRLVAGRRAARAGCRAPRGRSRRRSRASRAPDEPPARRSRATTWSLPPCRGRACAGRRTLVSPWSRSAPDLRFAAGGVGRRRRRHWVAPARARHVAGRTTGPAGKRGHDLRRRRARSLPAPVEPAGQRLDARSGRLLREPREHVEILPLDDRPVVVLAEELRGRSARASRSASGSARSRGASRRTRRALS